MKKYNTKHNTGEWKFDDNVAESFDLIAAKNIPNYEKVILKCLLVADKAFSGKKNIEILDVGSATGKTLDVFVKRGYKNVHGVESSESMKKKSLHQNRVILSEYFPKLKKKFDLVTINWTLHFIHKREEYLKEVYQGISKGGYLILTDKISSSDLVHSLYHDFKRSNGLSENEIRKKKLAIQNVLVTKPLDWYLGTLKKVGFKKIEIVDADWSFVTILAKK